MQTGAFCRPSPPAQRKANAQMDPARWKEYCFGVAEAMHTLADRTDDPKIIALCLETAVIWMRAGDNPPRESGAAGELA